MTARQSIPNRRIVIGGSDAPIPQQANVEQISSPVHTRSVQQSLRDVWPDKPHPQPARVASPQPAALTKEMRAHQMSTHPPRTQNRSIATRKTVKVTLWVKPGVKAELERIAEMEGISVSATGAAF